MELLYIDFRMNLVRILVSTFLCLTFLSCFGQQARHAAKKGSNTGISGQYQQVNGNELLFLNKDETFVCIRNHFQKSDVVIPLCDTLGKGFWRLKNRFLILKNNDDFNKIDYAVLESEMKSKDSMYFKIVLPEEDALSYSNFKFSIITSPVYRQFAETGKREFSISNEQWKSVAFGFIIQNIAPNVYYGMKSYQRAYFKVFESYKPINNRANYFTIIVKNFNQCFYEAMDIDGEIIGVDNNTLLWRGNTYRKIE